MHKVLMMVALAATCQAAHLKTHFANVTLDVRVDESIQTFPGMTQATLNQAMKDWAAAKVGNITMAQKDSLTLQFTDLEASIKFLSQTVFKARMYITSENAMPDMAEKAALMKAQEMLFEMVNVAATPNYNAWRRNNTMITEAQYAALAEVQEITIDCADYGMVMQPTWVAHYDFGDYDHQCETDDDTSGGLRFAYALLAIVIIGFLVGAAMILTGRSNEGTPAPAQAVTEPVAETA